MFVFSIAVGAPKIATLMLDSYLKYHDTPIHIFCSEKDRDLLSVRYHDQDIIKYEIVDKSTEALFEYGHLGTSKIYADLIEDPSVDATLVHIDTDLLFRGEAISLIQDKFREGYSLVGPMRLYKNNPNNRRDCDYRPHVTQTYFFGFDKSKITKRNPDVLHRMAQGHPIDGQPVIDFFDPLAFDILQNGGRVFHLDRLDVGGFSEDSKLHNSEGFSHEDLDWGSKLVHFGGGGTGERVCRGEGLNIPKGYADWALERYKMISNLFGLEDTVFELSEAKSKLFKKIMDNIKTSVSDYREKKVLDIYESTVFKKPL